jgi:hypothetical protein
MMTTKIKEASDLLDTLITNNRDASRKWGDALILATILLELQELNKNIKALAPKAKNPGRKPKETK